jgi:23S rRNA (cytosine1962-C5)-methyltransferase
MFVAKDLVDYRILDTGEGMKLERWKNVTLSRPDPQVIWKKDSPKLWNKVDAVYHRNDSGGGDWEFFTQVPDRWIFNYKGIRMYVKPTGFKHTGIFPEQSANWDWMIDKIRLSRRDNIKVLNLFGYTGGASLACLKAGASVVHVDSASSMNSWFKENLILSELDKKDIRYIADDCVKFVLREQRRGNTYDAIIMDPPSYGRGKGGEIWKMEKDVENLIFQCSKIMTRNPLFFMLSSYTTGLSSIVMDNMIKRNIVSKYKGKVKGDTLCIPIDNSNLYLPCGTTSRWER